MPTLEKADARMDLDIVDSEELARLLATGSGGEVVLRSDMEDMFGSGTLILDGLRRRPRYFDGRFLTGADLTRDQDYVRQRQADIARAGGSGVISGLLVDDVDSVGGTALRIEPGHGVTPSGDLVMLTETRRVPVMDLPTTRQLDAAMGLSAEPRVPLTNRSGVFVLGLRAVEFTANPIAAYPRSITGKRTVEDGDIIEATAITLVPYPAGSEAATTTEARRAVARQVFGGNGPVGIPQNILPIAMVALDRGSVRWVDIAMVRREVGTDSGVQISLGRRPRAQAEAHVLQYRAHLHDVLSEMTSRGLSPIFPASQHFALMPSAGQLPAAAVSPDEQGLQQLFFPPSVEADIAFVPSDEIAALVEEALVLPPIDLEGSAEDLDATSVTILVPVSRPTFQRFAHSLPATSARVRPGPAAGGSQPALDMLDALVLRRRKALEAVARNAAARASEEAMTLERRAWQGALEEAAASLATADGLPPMFWYVRQRAVAQRTNTEGLAIIVGSDDVVVADIVGDNLTRLRLKTRFAELESQATPQARARITSLLGAPTIAASDIMTVAVIADLERAAAPEAQPLPTPPTLPPSGGFRIPTPDRLSPFSRIRDISGATDLAIARDGLRRINAATILGTAPASRASTDLNLSEAEVLDIAADYASPRLGEGFERVAPMIDDDWPNSATALAIGESGVALELDHGLRLVARNELSEVADKLNAAASSDDGDALADLAKSLLA